MLRRPASPYEFQRSTTLYKYKPTHDAEARVVGYEAGQVRACTKPLIQSRIAGLVGSLVCETLTEPVIRFRVGSGLNDAVLRDPPRIGAIVNFSYGMLSSQGIPRFPRFRGVLEEPP